ncbi:MAG: M15 family metallopeptidase [Oscillospiraceae bacterium]|nr:M15 family metallopeptidase [Oscillospiraceae bacterium]
MAEKKKGNGAAVFFDVIFSLALIAGVSYGGYYLVTHGSAVEQKETYAENFVEETTEEPTEETDILYTEIAVSTQELHNGSLILVNEEVPFQGSTEDIVILADEMQMQDCKSFGVKDRTVQAKKEVSDAMIAMFNAFYDATSKDDIVIQEGYRSAERQQELYDAERTPLQVGYSEHQTGLGINLTLLEAQYDGTGDYRWINEHCTEYGFILRYPENKTSVTKIDYEPEHYRYVGKPHAQYIMQSNICLEEYITLLYGYSYEKEHLRIIDAENKIYEVYYYPADTSAETTSVFVPEGKNYILSGNNRDGFIITFDTGETAVPEEVQETEIPPEAEEIVDESANL